MNAPHWVSNAMMNSLCSQVLTGFDEILPIRPGCLDFHKTYTVSCVQCCGRGFYNAQLLEPHFAENLR